MVKTPFMSFRQIIRILCRSSGHFSYHPDTSRIIRTLCRSSRNFADHPQIFYIVWLITPKTIWICYGRYSRHPAGQEEKTFQICKKIAYTLMRILWLCPAPMTISWLDPSEPTWPWSLHECRDATLSKCTGAIEHCFIHPGSCWWISPSSHLKKYPQENPNPNTKYKNTEILQITETWTRGLKRPRYQGVGISLRRLSPDSIRKTRSSPHCTGPSIVNTKIQNVIRNIKYYVHWEAFWFK